MDEKRMNELAERSRQRGVFVYTDFLNEQTQAELAAKFFGISFWGGAEFAERKIARFGDGNCFGENFPLSIVKIHPTGGKFAAEMGHRDVFGALMSLGITREKVGDIFAGDDCFAVVHESVAKFVKENLTTVGKNNVETEFAENVPKEFAPKKREVKFSAQSDRADNIVCGVFNISREKACQLAETGKIFVNGAECLKPAKNLKDGDVVSVRGFGKFLFCGECGTSKKGKTYFSVEVFE